MRVFQQFTLVCLSVMICTASHVMAGGLQVTPTVLKLQTTQNADGIWLSNEGDEPLDAQVRLYHWTQSDYSNKLAHAQGLVISPPLLKLLPGEKQLVRVIRTGPVGATNEDAWRVSIDELPPPKALMRRIKFVMHYSLPIFVQPEGMTDVAPRLQWRLVQAEGKAFIEVSNQGNGHAQLSQATFISGGGARKVISSGLLGYVLPGATMRWIISTAIKVKDRKGKIEVVINGKKTVQQL